MSDSSFTAQNRLERALLDTMEGKIVFSKFLKFFLKCSLSVPSGTEVLFRGMGFRPLLFEREQGTLLAAFTSKDRLRAFAKEAPYCLEMKGRQLIASMPNDLGLVVNPGFSVGFEIPASGLQEIRNTVLG